jgi:hypothetical protein
MSNRTRYKKSRNVKLKGKSRRRGGGPEYRVMLVSSNVSNEAIRSAIDRHLRNTENNSYVTSFKVRGPLTHVTLRDAFYDSYIPMVMGSRVGRFNMETDGMELDPSPHMTFDRPIPTVLDHANTDRDFLFQLKTFRPRN